MTQTEFNALPGLLARKQFCQLSGLNRNELARLVESGEIRKMTYQKDGRGRYYKADLAKYFGFK